MLFYGIIIFTLASSIIYNHYHKMSIDYEALIKKYPLPTWDLTPQQIADTAEDLAKRDKEINDYVASIEDPTIENVLEPWIEFSDSVLLLSNQLLFYSSVSADKELRDASNKAEEYLTEKDLEQATRLDVFKVFKKLYEKVKDSDVDAETKKLLEKTVNDYRRIGLDLPEDKREEAKKIKLELSNLSIEFQKNMNENAEFEVFTLEELDGVPQDVIDGFEKTEDGKYKMTFKYPELFPVLKYAKNQQTRKTAFNGNQNKNPENAEILKKLVEGRFKFAKLLGYDTYSNYILEDRIAKNQNNVMDFLNDLKAKLLPLGEDDLARLNAFKNEDLVARGLEAQDEFYAWDTQFYNTLLLEKEYKVDHIKISEYFPLDLTIEKMFRFYEHLFDVKFVKVQNPDPKYLWHEDVKIFGVFQDIKSGKPVFDGYLVLDLHPRLGKYGHAANFGLGSGATRKDGSRVHPYTVLVCNFTKPTKEKPSLLKHNEVTTFFHELGHGMHNLLSKTKYLRFHGTHVPRDFVETPSQMLEFWTWSKNELKALSSHYITGEPISDDLIDQLVKSKNVNEGLFNLRQLFFGLFDMSLHTLSTADEIEKLDINENWNDLTKSVALVSNGGLTNIGYASFGHIAGGYQSGYYGYLYSQVFAVDIYYTLFKEDPMNAESGIRYRDIVLKRGGSLEILDILTEVLGRPPNNEAFLKEILGN